MTAVDTNIALRLQLDEAARKIRELQAERDLLYTRPETMKEICGMKAEKAVKILLAHREREAKGGELTIDDYEEVLADHRWLVRALDVAMNGEDGAAPQASLCDLVLQAAAMRRELRALRAEAPSSAAPKTDFITLSKRHYVVDLDPMEIRIRASSIKMLEPTCNSCVVHTNTDWRFEVNETRDEIEALIAATA